MSRILIVNGNPKPASLCGALAERYAIAASGAGHDTRIVQVGELDFDPDLHLGYDGEQALEPDLQAFQQSWQWAEHLVFAFPVWWGTMPARLKGLLDRTLLPGFAFRYQSGKSIPERLLTGRTARLLVTLDTPVWYYRWWQGAPAVRQMQRTVLEFVGTRQVRHRYFGPVIGSTPEQRRQWLAEAEHLGLAAA